MVPVVVEHDPLQFGPEDAQAHEEELPAAYGTSSDASHAFANASAPPAAAAHDPLAPAAPDAATASKPSWNHYPDPADITSTATTVAPAASASTGQTQQQQQHQVAPVSTVHYPSVPADFNISLSPASSSLAGSAQATPRAGASAAGPLVRADSLPTSNPQLRIAVLNPLRHMGPSAIPGLEEAYISYEVVTNTSLPHFSGTHFSVRRRFRDFVSLSNLLPKLLHGSFLPARPDKNIIEGRRMTDAFVESRRAALERYLNRLAAHPAASRSEVLRVFLEADGNLRSNPQWKVLKPSVLTPTQATSRLLRSLVGLRKTAPTPSEVVQPAAACRDVYRLLHENVQQLRGTFKHSPLSPEELALRDDTVLVEDAAAALHVALNRAEAWARLAAARSGALAETAVSLEALASFEGSYTYGEQQALQAVALAAQGAQTTSTVASTAASAASTALQPLRDHHAITPNVLGALRLRERQLLTVLTLRQDLEDKRARLQAAQLMPASQARKVDTLRSQVGQLEVSSAAAEAEYTRQLQRNKEELQSLRASRATELTAMLAEVVSSELKHQQQEEAIWQQVLAKLPQPPKTGGVS